MMLRPGDKVMWRGCFGTDDPQVATIASITAGGKYGKEVKEVEWEDVWFRENGRYIVVDLSDPHDTWAYGSQIARIVACLRDRW